MTSGFALWGFAILGTITVSILLAGWLGKRADAQARRDAQNAEYRLAAQARVAARDAAAAAVRAGWIEDAKAGLSGPWDKPSRPARAGGTSGYSGNNRNARYEPDYRYDDPQQFNPASGLPMVGNSGIDVGGHVFGSTD